MIEKGALRTWFRGLNTLEAELQDLLPNWMWERERQELKIWVTPSVPSPRSSQSNVVET